LEFSLTEMADKFSFDGDFWAHQKKLDVTVTWTFGRNTIVRVWVASGDHVFALTDSFLSLGLNKLYDPCLWHGYSLRSQPPSGRVNSLLGQTPGVAPHLSICF
jgi:hypothetical protein